MSVNMYILNYSYFYLWRFRVGFCIFTLFACNTEWETNGARGGVDSFSIGCWFISSNSCYQLYFIKHVFLLEMIWSNTICVHRNTSKSIMMQLCLTWKQSWWMQRTSLIVCFVPNPWNALVWLEWLLERRSSGTTLSRWEWMISSTWFSAVVLILISALWVMCGKYMMCTVSCNPFYNAIYSNL